eukprot:321280_1
MGCHSSRQARECVLKEANGGKLIHKCPHLYRICNALQLYDSLLIEKETIIAQREFTVFCMESYAEYLNDYIHITVEHGDLLTNAIRLELQQNFTFKECTDVSHCTRTERHFEKRNRERKQNEAPEEYSLHIDIFDSLHFYINHLEILGLRSSKEQKHDNHGSKAIYDEIKMDIKVQDEKYDPLNMKNIENMSKFNIAVAETQDDNSKSRDLTFMDSMFLHLKERENHSNVTNSFRTFLVSEQYDSDCIFDDFEFEHNSKQSNLLTAVNNDTKFLKSVKSFSKMYNVKKSSFSTGLVFWYWSWYREQYSNRELEQKQGIWNQNNYQGYSVNELFVDSHFVSLQEEALESGFLSLDIFKEKIIGKAKAYIKTKKCKKIKCIELGDELHFGIEYGAPLSQKHLQSLLLYTDFTEFCTDFSTTFRPNSVDETIATITKRNSKYHCISKHLRELIQYFGINGLESSNGHEFGMFYCGMNCKMNIPEFAIRLNGPSSTTKQIQIAQRFSGIQGIIIQLNNKSYSGQREVFFDTSWISSYWEEDERIMFGGRWKLEIES